MNRRVLVGMLLNAGFVSKGGAKHEMLSKDGINVLVKRHREIEEQVALRILRQAGLR